MSKKKTAAKIPDDGKIEIEIRASQKIHYLRTVRMTPKEWEELKRLPEKRAAEVVLDWLRLDDVLDAEDLESDEWEAYALDAKGNPKKPEDAYMGGE